ncbi:alpha/beta fold hydrolase [Lentzea sp. BCCO 10_0061]|uniref:Alpha/beta fold hydrolase n=1 Tax=Lentzea sokolovensis TaxID=3095429 RepID=A0ABU4VEY4_9PSEU|nr:alpha/beta fold hydrolase [Lentzea sp. BCCO 10_0061]MDX8149493.1 alpha/beta fold hydrolase [Lentzea sp. BCCO 10_0061]
MTTTAPWRQHLRLLAAPPEARARIVCVAPAGGGASTFQPWAVDPPQGVEIWAVQLPGREDRLQEAPFTDVTEAARRVAMALQWLVDRPCVVFGHSLGALIGYEAVRVLAAQGTDGVSHLVVSGCRPPDSHRPRPELVRSDQDAVDELARLGLSPSAFDDQETRSVVLPAMRGDLRMFYSYEHRSGATPACPIIALAGDEDPHVSEVDLLGWRRHTSATTTTAVLPGGHHYLADVHPRIVQMIVEAVGDTISG